MTRLTQYGFMERKKFKDTKFGEWLTKVGRKTPEVMEKVGDVIGGPWGQIVATVGGALDSAIKKDPDNQDLAAAIDEFKEFEELFRLEYEYHTIEVQEITKRWEADLKSDSWLAKNIRPLVLGYLIISFTFVAVFDSVDTLAFNLKDAYITVFETLLITVVVAYYGSRGVEKTYGAFKRQSP